MRRTCSRAALPAGRLAPRLELQSPAQELQVGGRALGVLAGCRIGDDGLVGARRLRVAAELLQAPRAPVGLLRRGRGAALEQLERLAPAAALVVRARQTQRVGRV